MRYERVCLEAIGYCLPSEIVTSGQLEAQLAPLYERLRLPEGRLELITGVRERRFWPAGTLPSQFSQISGQLALEAAGWPAERIGALVHGSVCRDFLEPATASGVHCGLGLPSDCAVYDVSNACLGLMNGVLQVANLIELQQIEAGLVVGTESGRQLVETTIKTLNSDHSLSREQLKLAIASLTIGSASCALLLVDRRLSRSGSRLLGGCLQAFTAHHQLCRSGRDEAVAAGMQPLMQTDSERLMHEGIAAGRTTFEKLLAQLSWRRQQIDKTICHQVGRTHRRMMFEQLELPTEADFTTVEWLGNTGSVALPITLARAQQQQHLEHGNRVALMGIGSGINCIMLGCQWGSCAVSGRDMAQQQRTAATSAS